MFFFVFYICSIRSFAKEIKINIIHTNDIHGNVESVYDAGGLLKNIGFDYLASIKKNTSNSILVDAGDVSEGTFLGKADEGKYVYKLMQDVGYDIMTFGNHEFDLGVSALKKRINEVNFKIISSNVEYLNDFLTLPSYIKEISGKKIGFFGITTSETSRIMPPQNLENISFKNEILSSKQQIENLKKQNVDAIVGIFHVGNNSSSDNITSEEIVKKVPGIDAVIDAHSHKSYTKKVDKTTIAQTGCELNNVGLMEVIFDDKNNLEINSKILNPNIVEKTFVPDADVTKNIENIKNNLSHESDRVIGKINSSFFGGNFLERNITRLFETSLGDLICDSLIWEAKKVLKTPEFSESDDENIKKILNLPVVSFENGGAIRNSLKKGYLTFSDVFSVLPSNNHLTFQIVTPAEIYEIIERGVGKLKKDEKNNIFLGEFGGFPQVAGLKIEFNVNDVPYDYNLEKAETTQKNILARRVTSISLTDESEKEIKKLNREDDKTRILFLCNDYTLYEFPAIKNIEIIFKGRSLFEILSDFICKLTLENPDGFSYAFSKNRIKLNANSNPFKGKITLCDKTGVLNLKNVSVIIDDSNEKRVKTNKDGEIFLNNLKPGAHIIVIKYENMSKETIISNISDLTDVHIFMEDDVNEDYFIISNLIGQIPYNITKDNESFIIFSRKSYDSLDNAQKLKVFNYNKLENAEKEISKLKGNVVDVFFSKDNNKRFIAFVFLTSISLLFIYFITKYRKRKYILK